MTLLGRLVRGLFGVILLASAPASAEYQHRVVLLEQGDEAGFTELHARLRGELGAAGFEVVEVPLAAGEDPKLASEAASGALHPAAVLYVVPGPAESTDGTELWIDDRLLRRTLIVHLNVGTPSSADAAHAAVQAAELLKADLAELSVTREPAAPVKKAPPPPPKRDERLERRSGRFSVEPGVALIQGFAGIGSEWSPILRVGLSLPTSWWASQREPPVWEIRGKIAAFGTRARLETDAGAARVGQSLAGVEVAWRALPRSVVQPFVVVSGDAYVVHVEGESAPVTHSRTTWSFASGAGGGVEFVAAGDARPSLAFTLTALAELAWAPTEIRIAGERVATAGSPLVLMSAGAVGAF